VTNVAYLQIDSNPMLTTLQGIDNLEHCTSLDIAENQSLATLHALSSVDSAVERFRVSNNPSLPTCEAEWLLARVNAQNSRIEDNDNAGSCSP
jgi:hypothetical protein